MITIGVDQQISQFVSKIKLSNEWVCQQRPEHAFSPAVDRSIQGQLLVRRDVGDEPGVQRVDCCHRLRSRAVAPDPRRNLNHRLISEERQRPVVAHVDHLQITLISDQGRHQIHRCLRVKRSATPSQQIGFLIDRGIGIDLQKPVLDFGHLRCAGRLCPLLLDDMIMFIEIAEIVGGPDSQPSQQPGWKPGTLRQGFDRVGKQVRKPILAVDQNLPGPGQVIEPNVIKQYLRRLNAKQAGNRPLIADRCVAEPDRPMPMIKKGTRHNAHRICEIDDPGVFRSQPGDPFGNLQDHWHRTECLGQAASTRGLLAQAATLQREGLVQRSRRLSSNPQLDQYHSGICHGLVKIKCGRDLPGIAVFVQDPLRNPADEREPLRCRISQYELINRDEVLQPGDPIDQLGCVGGASPYHGDLHPSHATSRLRAVAHVSSPELLVLHGLRVKGMADAATVAERFVLDRELVDELLLDYEAFGWITRVGFADVTGWALTATGRAEDQRRLAAELDETHTRSEVVAAHEVFSVLNSRFLVTVTNWQIRPKPTDPIAVNDHGDPRWDERVLDDLRDLGTSVEPLCEQLTTALERFAGYSERYAAAFDKAARGERAWIAQPKIDSCHTVWMEFHEDLLATLGLERNS
jgi:hypothetical protein